MLIAMMGNTFQSVIAKSEKEWKKKQVGSSESCIVGGGGARSIELNRETLG